MPHKIQGLTLIEVLVALAIIAISLTAVIKAASENIRATGYIQNKSIALWVGQEVMSEVQTGALKLDASRGEDSRTITVLGQNFFWQAQEKSTGNPHIKVVHVRVYEHEPEDEDAAALADLDGYRYHAAT